MAAACRELLGSCTMNLNCKSSMYNEQILMHIKINDTVFTCPFTPSFCIIFVNYALVHNSTYASIIADLYTIDIHINLY